MSTGEDKTRAKIKELEFEYARTQKNKATEGHLGLLKAKIAKLQRELVCELPLLSFPTPLSIHVCTFPFVCFSSIVDVQKSYP